MLAAELMFRNESSKIDGNFGSGIATTVAIANRPLGEAPKLFKRLL
jgi:hypothetical protein